MDMNYWEKLHNMHNELSFMAEKMEINKVNKLVANLNNKENYVCTFEL